MTAEDTQPRFPFAPDSFPNLELQLEFFSAAATIF